MPTAAILALAIVLAGFVAVALRRGVVTRRRKYSEPAIETPRDAAVGTHVFDAVDHEAIALLKSDPEAFFRASRCMPPWCKHIDEDR